MSTESFPSKELLEVIRGQARMEEKIDSILRIQTDLTTKVAIHDAKITALEKDSIRGKSYIAGAGAVGGAGMTFLIPFIRSKLGI